MHSRVKPPGALLVICTLLGPVAWALAGHAPQVVKMFPENGATDVDPGITEIWVKFDCDMDTSGYSFCGGGPAFPKSGGKTGWVSDRKIVMRVQLEPDHEYHMSLNCPAAQSFRSDDGTPLAPVPWSFSTAARAQTDPEQQKKLNARCLHQLMTLLAERYSYYELRKIDWKIREKEHHQKIVAAKNTREWVKRTAEMLEVAEDIHLWMKYRDAGTPTFRRKVALNFDLDGIKKVLPDLEQRNACVWTARTNDGIGYLLITTLSGDRKEQLGKVPGYLKSLKECKALIVDLRPNGGGSEPLAMPIAAWFVKGEKIYSKNVYREPDRKSGWTEVFDRTIKGNKESKRFDKPTAVLIGPGIMSSAESFVLMMKQGEQVTLIGQTTYGSSGNPKPYKLDNEVEVYIPSWKDLLPDGTGLEGQGIPPDLEVKAKPADFKRGDPVIKQALKHLREKAG